MKEDCRWLNDVECPFASGYQKCDDCEKYEPEVHPSDCGCPDCDADKGCAQFHMRQDMGEL